jgi:hypothetical protein
VSELWNDPDLTRKYIAPLVGATVTGVEVRLGGPHAWAHLTVELATGEKRRLSIDSDSEGNGAGFIFGLDNPGAGQGGSHAARELDFHRRYLAPLEGAKVTRVDVLEEDDEAWPQIMVRLPDGGEEIALEISRDQEGNGPGFIGGLDWPPAD